MIPSSRTLTCSVTRIASGSFRTRPISRPSPRSSFSTRVAVRNARPFPSWRWTGVSVVGLASIGYQASSYDTTTSLDSAALETPTVPSSSSVVENKTTQAVEEPVTGISFAPSFQGKELLGVGVRKKFYIINVYAAAVYVDNPDDFRGLKTTQQQEEALLDPTKPRTIRIVFNRTVTMEQVVAALQEAIEPRMHGKDLHCLKDFDLLRQHGQPMHKGDDTVVTITEDKVWLGDKHVTVSKVYARAICDVYFGQDCISPSLKESTLEGIKDWS